MPGAERWLASHAGSRAARASQDSMYASMDAGNDENRSPASASRRTSRPMTGPKQTHTTQWQASSADTTVVASSTVQAALTSLCTRPPSVRVGKVVQQPELLPPVTGHSRQVRQRSGIAISATACYVKGTMVLSALMCAQGHARRTQLMICWLRLCCVPQHPTAATLMTLARLPVASQTQPPFFRTERLCSARSAACRVPACAVAAAVHQRCTVRRHGCQTEDVIAAISSLLSSRRRLVSPHCSHCTMRVSQLS
jgi:hypothetical protein